MISDDVINKAKSKLNIQNAHHEHNDCIRIAYQWLDAQNKLTRIGNHAFDLKHLIESWGGRFISPHDVDVAAYLHTEINGKYGAYNISKRLIEPSITRLESIEQAN